MKKYILLLTLTTLLFSCTDDVIDTSSGANINLPTDPTEAVVLVKKIKITYSDNDELILNYNYDGNQLLNVTHEDGSIMVSYTYNENGLLIRIDYVAFEAFTTFNYNTTNNTIDIFELYHIDYPAQEHTVIYNSDDTITVENYYDGVLTSEDLITLDSNGNIIKIVDDTNEYVNNFTYDTKNNAYKNVSNIEIFHLSGATTEYGFDFVNGNFNNMNNWTETYQGEEVVENWDFTYNSEDYPTNAVLYYDGIEDAIVEYFYE